MSYSGPSYVQGGYPVFAGSRRQVGGGILGSIGRLVFPALKKVAVPLLKKAGRSLLSIGTNVAADALSGKNFQDSLQQHGRAAALDALNSVNTRINTVRPVGSRRARKGRRLRQVGSGRVTKQRRRKRRRTVKRSRRRLSTQTKKSTRSRKRRKTTRGPRSKRRKTSYF